MLRTSSVLVPLAALAALASAVPSAAQSGAAPGLRLYGDLRGFDTYLVDVQGNIVHTWTNTQLVGTAAHLDRDGTLIRTYRSATLNIPGAGGGFQRIGFDGRVLWDWTYDTPGGFAHHDFCIKPNGNILFIAWEDITPQQAIANGRDPALIRQPVVRPDKIVEIEPVGTNGANIVWEWRVWDHLVQDFDPSQANFGVVSQNPGKIDINYPPDPFEINDWNHCNGIDYDPIHDWIVISSNHQSEIWIIDGSTSTAEAASDTGGRWGKGGQILWRWGNPECYDAGGPADRVFDGNHDPRFIPAGRPGAGNLTVYHNGNQNQRSDVFELTLPTDAYGNFVIGLSGRFGPALPTWSFTAPNLFSGFISGCERLPNGNTLICSGNQGLLLEVTPSGRTVWQHQRQGMLIFQCDYVERTLWSEFETVSAGQGSFVGLNMVAGGEQAGRDYVVLGTASGSRPGFAIDGHVMPINIDAFTQLTLTQANFQPFFANTLGSLDASGAASAMLGIPAGALPPGLTLEFAFAAIDPVTGLVTATSNAVPIRLVQ